jgi:hypothetical protein
MGKTREGQYIPPKGKPSGDGQPKGAGNLPVNHIDNLEERDRIADTYTDGPDQPARMYGPAPQPEREQRHIDQDSYGWRTLGIRELERLGRELGFGEFERNGLRTPSQTPVF